MYFIPVDKDNAADFATCIPERFLNKEGILCLGAVDDDSRAAGGIACMADGRDFVLLWIYVIQEARRKGIASGLLRFLLQQMMFTPEMRRVTVSFEKDEISNELTEILNKFDFSISEEEIGVYDVSYRMVSMPAQAEKVLDAPGIMDIGNVPKYFLNQIDRLIEERSIAVAVDIPIDWKSYDQELSMVKITDNEVAGFMLVSNENDEIEISYALVFPGRSITFLELLLQFVERFKEKYGDEKTVRIVAITDTVDGIIRKLVPGVTRMKTVNAEMSLV